MIIDAHVHVLPDRVRDDLAAIRAADPWFGACHGDTARVASAESLIATMDANGIDRAVCFTWPFADPLLCAEANDYVAAAQRRHPDRLIGAGVVNPADPEAPAEVRRCAELGLRALGELNADAQGFAWTDQEVAGPVLDAARACGMAVTVHCSEPLGHLYPGKGTATPEQILLLAERNPEADLVCAHLGGGLPFFGLMPEVAAVCRRLWFDTAAQPFLYDAAVYATLESTVGLDRIIFGSDHPLLDAPRYRAALVAAGLDAGAIAQVMGGNAAPVYLR